MALVQAAQQLIDEVHAVHGRKDDVKALDETDGLGFQREVRLTPGVVKALGDDVLEALEADDRIEEIVRSSAGAKVVFVADSRADFNHSFDVAAAVEAAQ